MTTSDIINQTKKNKTRVEYALDLEKLDENLYRSKELWKPMKARGVFGGQVCGQSLAAATATVDSAFHVHSLHCYFAMAGNHEIPIIYRVSRIRDGKSFVIRQVTATQNNGKIIFTCTCSFQIPEISNLNFQIAMPDIPPPEQVPSDKENFRKWLTNDKLKKFHNFLQMKIEEPLAIEFKPLQKVSPFFLVDPQNDKAISNKQYVWIKAVGRLPDDLRFHHIVAAYACDHYLLTTALLPNHLSSFSTPRLKMMASLDHTVWFHQPFRIDEWLLFEMECTKSNGNRATTSGRFFTQTGQLVLSCAQEGLIRADVLVQGKL